MFRRRPDVTSEADDLDRVEAMVRSRFSLASADLVLVAEEPPRGPGYPPVETRVTFWYGGTRHAFAVFRPAAGITPADLPEFWALPTLSAAGPDICC